MRSTIPPRALLVAAAITLALGSAGQRAAAEGQTLSKDELHELIRNARTRQDHERVAAYYRAEAQRLKAAGKEHAETAAKYEDRIIGYKGSFPDRHCKALAAGYARTAAYVRALAEYHEKMAERLAKHEAPNP